MKRKILVIILLFCVNFLFSQEKLTYILIEDCLSYDTSIDYDYVINRVKELKQNEKIICLADFADTFFYREQDYYLVPVSALKPIDSETVLPDSIISVKDGEITKKAIPVYFLDILKSKDSKTIGQYEEFFSRPSDYLDAIGINNTILSKMFSDVLYSSTYIFTWGFTVVSNVGIRFSNYDEIYFEDIMKESAFTYVCNGFAKKAYEEWNPTRNFWKTYVENTPKGKREAFTITIDGDYITVDNKSRGTHITSFVYVDDSILRELSALFANNTCDLTKVTWPRHADGSCDYEDTTSVKTASTAITSMYPNKIMTVKENLRLRSGEGTSSQVVTVLPTGSRVRIMEVGKAETIDGISSNWVLVESQSHTKDRDGKIIYAGTQGWCFGGYLE